MFVTDAGDGWQTLPNRDPPTFRLGPATDERHRVTQADTVYHNELASRYDEREELFHPRVMSMSRRLAPENWVKAVTLRAGDETERLAEYHQFHGRGLRARELPRTLRGARLHLDQNPLPQRTFSWPARGPTRLQMGAKASVAPGWIGGPISNELPHGGQKDEELKAGMTATETRSECITHSVEFSPTPWPPLGAGRVLAVPCAYNEMPKIGRVLDRIAGLVDVDVLVVDDASTDGTTQLLLERGVRTIRHQRRRGAGACVRTAIHYFLEHHYDVLVFMAGNDKDRPAEISRLVNPILCDEADLVQGSRYLPGGRTANMPRYRQIATRYIHPWLFSRLSGLRMTDTTNGFRAISRRVLEDPRVDLEPSWLDHYELEPYLLYKAIRLGYRVGEVPVSKFYPPKSLGYTKMKPIFGWWSIVRPIVLLGLGLRR